ncbi:MAG: hypothetical protein BKP49_02765 [Treponema sp. CETP13]|nr:MAG: hypothetical protein BKP49_02765 [Treponema sp. CETP13]
MRKSWLFLFVLMSISLLDFLGCKSTPEEESVPSESVVEAPQPEPEPEAELEPVPEPAEPVYDWTSDNESLIAKITEARVKAIAAGAELYLPEELGVIDSDSNKIQSAYAEGGDPEEFNTSGQNIVLLYEALEQSSIASVRYERINGFDFASYDQDSYDEGVSAAAKARDLLANNGTGAEILEASTLAANSYDKVLNTAFTQKANDKRLEVLDIKKLADSIKANVAQKEQYENAIGFFSNGNKLLQEGDSEEAYNSFSKSLEDLTIVYNNVLEKREAAQAAIEKAKKRIEQSQIKASDADSVAPINEADPEQAAAQDMEEETLNLEKDGE